MAAPNKEGRPQTRAVYIWNDGLGEFVAWDGAVTGAFSTAVPGTLANGQKTVTLAGTAEVLGASTVIQSIVIQALGANTGFIYVGDSGVSSANGYVLRRNASVAFDIDNLADVFIDSSVNGEGVSFATVAA